MADEGLGRVGALLEQLTARFELVVEAVSGLGGRIDTLRSEMFAQFAEVGKQIRFLSQQIGENREGLAELRGELTAEAVRLAEAIGATRVEFRKHLADAQTAMRSEIGTRFAEGGAELRNQVARVVEDRNKALRGEIASDVEERATAMRAQIREQADEVREELAKEVADTVSRQLGAEVKQVQKAIGALSKKLDRFDDRVSVQVKESEHRLRKLERSRA